MGNNCCTVKGAIDHWIYIKSGDRKGRGDITINIRLYDDMKHSTESIQLSIDCQREIKTTDVYQVPPEMVANFGNTVQVELSQEDTDNSDDWYCEVIMVNDTRSQIKEKCYYFPVQRWLNRGHTYMIRVNDTCLPVNDPYSEQRAYELSDACTSYAYLEDDPALPAVVSIKEAITISIMFGLFLVWPCGVTYLVWCSEQKPPYIIWGFRGVSGVCKGVRCWRVALTQLFDPKYYSTSLSNI